ncbi:MAG TPA: hypothetical protein VFJ09_04335 [Nocardioidaceae bacterium]|nr:hypothetical protein [Nocardioidaceae bacterium]
MSTGTVSSGDDGRFEVISAFDTTGLGEGERDGLALVTIEFGVCAPLLFTEQPAAPAETSSSPAVIATPRR